jgi:hypothetical protein
MIIKLKKILNVFWKDVLKDSKIILRIKHWSKRAHVALNNVAEPLLSITLFIFLIATKT